MTRETLSLKKQIDNLDLKGEEETVPPKKKSPDKAASKEHLYLSVSQAWEEWVPLAIGFSDQAMQGKPEEISRSRLHFRIARRCSHPTYLAMFETCTHRMNFDGSPAQEITEEERSYARLRLVKMEGNNNANS